MWVEDLNNKSWHFLGFYGNPEADQKHHGWNLFRRLALGFARETSMKLWMSEKFRGAYRAPRLMANFGESIIDCGLLELDSGD